MAYTFPALPQYTFTSSYIIQKDSKSFGELKSRLFHAIGNRVDGVCHESGQLLNGLISSFLLQTDALL